MLILELLSVELSELGMNKKILFLFVFLLLAVKSVLAIPALNFNGFVADEAHVLSVQQVAKLNSLLKELQNKTTADIAVVTLKSLEGRPIEDVGIEIGRKYKVGKKGLDNGVVVLVAPTDRQMRIEVGYGLEGVITDGKAGRIRDTFMIPRFKENNYSQGIIDGTQAVALIIASDKGVGLSNIDEEIVNRNYYNPDIAGNSLFFLFWFTFVFAIIAISANTRGGGSSGGGSSFGGSSGGGSSFGGGGGFGGGGSSGRW